MCRLTGILLCLFISSAAHAAECISPLHDSHIAGIATFFGGYSPGFVVPEGVPVSSFKDYIKILSQDEANALQGAEYSIVKSVVLDQAKAGHLRDYMREAADTEIPWWISLSANVVPEAWVGIAADTLTATFDGLGASSRQSLSEAAGTIATGGIVQALERVARDGDRTAPLFVAVLVYQTRVGEEYRTTLLQRCTAPVRIRD